MKTKMSLNLFVKCAMLTALSVVLTMFPKVPTPSGGYVHFGDSVIYLAAIFLGPLPGAIVGAVGHSLADLYSGYVIFCLPTFIIKGIMGYVIGKIAYKKIDRKHFLLAAICALIIVTFGYFVAEIGMFGFEAALLTFVTSPVQWLMSVVASAVLIPIFTKVDRYIK